MGRFSGKSSKAAREAKSIIRINPYELPEKALAVIAKICNINNVDNTTIIEEHLGSVLEKQNPWNSNWKEYCDGNCSVFARGNLYHELSELVSLLVDELISKEDANVTRVVVSGGFSAGKSSLLNMLIGLPHLLPTGIEPCSMVPTYLYCSKHNLEVEVKGVNLKNAVVRLDTDILQSIQHESKSKIYLASVIEKLFVELPSTGLDGLVFIDTPGYNNSEKANRENGKTDDQTSANEMKYGDVLLWVIDAGNGTITSNDRRQIEERLECQKNCKLVILFNKADKKGADGIKQIVSAAVASLQSSAYYDRVIDVLGYSAMENKVYYSASGYTLFQLINKIRDCGSCNSGVDDVLSDIDRLFVDEIQVLSDTIKELDESRNFCIDKKNDLYKESMDNKNDIQKICENLEDMIIGSYSGLCSATKKLQEGWDKSNMKWLDLQESVQEYERNRWGSSDVLEKAINRSVDNYNRMINLYNNINWNYYTVEGRKNYFQYVKQVLSDIESNDKEKYDVLDNDLRNYNEEKSLYQLILKQMEYYRTIVMDTLRQGIRMYQQCAHQVQDARLNMDYSQNVFAAIAKGSYEDFTACFAKGVNLNDFSADGYSPLTYAVKEGNIDMVRFFVEQGADLYAYDGRGQNAFHTAVQNGYRHICEYLLSEEPALGSTKTQRGEDVMNVSCQNDFSNWLSRNI